MRFHTPFHLFGMAVMFAMYLVLFMMFLGAYATDYTGSFVINKHGEANFELILLILSFPFCMATMADYAGLLAQRRKYDTKKTG